MARHSRDFFFFNDTATTEIYTLSLHDALPIYQGDQALRQRRPGRGAARRQGLQRRLPRTETGRQLHLQPRGQDRKEHTSELQSRQYLVCRLLLEKKKYPFLSLALTHRTSTRLL